MIKYFLFATMVISIGLISPTFAHEPNFEVDSSKDILKMCNFFYEEYVLLEREIFLDHHKLFLHAKICPVLFEHVAWNSNHPQKNYVLISEIEKKLDENSNYLKEKHLTPSSIPVDFKKKANLWLVSEITDSEFLDSIQDTFGIEFTNKKEIKYDRICSNVDSCLKINDYAEYEFHDKKGTEKTIVFNVIKIESKKTVLGAEPKKITIGIESTKNEKKTYQEIQLDIDKKFVETFQDYYLDRLIFSTHNQVNEKTDDNFQMTHKMKHSIKNENRKSFLVDDKRNDVVTIDQKTGLVLSLKHENPILDEYYELNLKNTNIFENTMLVESKEIPIPKWFKQNVQWYLDETVSKEEFLNSFSHLKTSVVEPDSLEYFIRSTA